VKTFYYIFLVWMYCQSSKATLILLIYNDGAIYFGADSQVTGGSSNTFLRSKIFTLDKTSCVAIVGCCGGNVEEMSGKQSFMLLPNVLKSACDETNEPTMSLQNKITRAVSKLDASHRIYMLTKTVANYSKTAYSMGLLFAGYDKIDNHFFWPVVSVS
jgi:hypothetical protein